MSTQVNTWNTPSQPYTDIFGKTQNLIPSLGWMAGPIAVGDKKHGYTNPNFDSRITRKGAFGSLGVPEVGYIMNTDWTGPGTDPKDGRPPVTLRFLYFPSNVTVNYGNEQSGDTISYLAAQQDPSTATTGPTFMQLNQQISFSVLFDRTFEMWISPVPFPNGVDVDILTMQLLCGMWTNWTVPASSTTGLQNPGASAIMQLTPAAIYLGSQRFFCQITGFSVNYTHWNQSLQPIRAAMSVSASMLPIPQTQNLETATKFYQTLPGPDKSSQKSNNAGKPGVGQGVITPGSGKGVR